MIKIIRFTIIISISIFFLLTACQVQGQDQDAGALVSQNRAIKGEVNLATLFMEAHKYYQEEKFGEAARSYEKLIQSEAANGKIYYNLGNCYFKMGLLGKAILSYRLSELYLPRDEDLKANLTYARQLTKDRIEQKQFLPFLKDFCFWYSKLNLKELLIVFLIAHALFWTLAIIRIFWRKEHYNLILLINLVLTLVLGASFALKLYHYTCTIDGVVLAKEITVRSGNGINNTSLFQLHDGAELRITEQHEDWYKIALGEDKRGWVESKWIGKCQVNSSLLSSTNHF